MKIYVAHSTNFDFSKELYQVIRTSPLNKEHEFILPHENSAKQFASKELFKQGCDLVLAEVSFRSTGLGIELGWADILKIPVACIYQEDKKPSASLQVVSKTFESYSSNQELVAVIDKIIQQFSK